MESPDFHSILPFHHRYNTVLRNGTSFQANAPFLKLSLALQCYNVNVLLLTSVCTPDVDSAGWGPCKHQPSTRGQETSTPLQPRWLNTNIVAADVVSNDTNTEMTASLICSNMGSGCSHAQVQHGYFGLLRVQEQLAAIWVQLH